MTNRICSPRWASIRSGEKRMPSTPSDMTTSTVRAGRPGSPGVPALDASCATAPVAAAATPMQATRNIRWPRAPCIPLLRRLTHRLARRPCGVLVDAAFALGAEVVDEPLDGPSGRVAQRANRVTLDLPGHVEQRIDLALLRPPVGHPHEHPPHPARALAARRALTATLVHVEVRDARDRADDVGGLVHHDRRRRAQPRAQLHQRVEVHRTVDDLLRRDE